jgi:hypothetical protein
MDIDLQFLVRRGYLKPRRTHDVLAFIHAVQRWWRDFVNEHSDNKEIWTKLPLELRQRYCKETNYDEFQPSPELQDEIRAYFLNEAARQQPD